MALSHMARVETEDGGEVRVSGILVSKGEVGEKGC